MEEGRGGKRTDGRWTGGGGNGRGPPSRNGKEKRRGRGRHSTILDRERDESSYRGEGVLIGTFVPTR